MSDNLTPVITLPEISLSEIKNNLYQIVKALLGPKHPYYNYDALNACADWLIKHLKDLGLTVQEQVFFVKGDAKPYRNLLAYWGALGSDITLIGAHYDTVPFTPAANDNLSAVAVSLELARLLSRSTHRPNVCFAFFTLEEGHPGYFAERHHLLVDRGLADEQGVFASIELLELSKAVQAYSRAQNNKTTYIEDLEAIMTGHALGADRHFSDMEQSYLEILMSTARSYTEDSPVGRANYTVGSHHFVEDYGQHIGRALILDCVGWISEKDRVNTPMPLKGLEAFVTSHLASPEQDTGNFIAFMGSQNSVEWLQALHGICATAGIDFPHMAIKLPIPYDAIRQMAPDTLRSDHAPFWRKGIPAIFVSDTANFRSNRYHTPADTIEHLNFDFLAGLVNSLNAFLRL